MVRRSCCVCGTRDGQGIALFSFPSQNLKRRKKWLQLVRCAIEDYQWNPQQKHCVCEVHFGEEQWESVRVDGSKKLKSSAVPSYLCDNKENASPVAIPGTPRRAPFGDVSNVAEVSAALPSPSVAVVEHMICSTPLRNPPVKERFLFVEVPADEDIVAQESISSDICIDYPAPKKLCFESQDLIDISSQMHVTSQSFCAPSDSVNEPEETTVPTTSSCASNVNNNVHSFFAPSDSVNEPEETEVPTTLSCASNDNNNVRSSDETDLIFDVTVVPSVLNAVNSETPQSCCQHPCSAQTSHDDAINTVLEKISNSAVKHEVKRIFDIFKKDFYLSEGNLKNLEGRTTLLDNYVCNQDSYILNEHKFVNSFCECSEPSSYDEAINTVLKKLGNSTLKDEIEELFKICRHNLCLLKQRIKNLEVRVLNLENTRNGLQKKCQARYYNLKRLQKNTQRNLDRLKEKHLKSHEGLASRFRSDQLSALLSKSSRGRKWSRATVREGLINRMKMGTKGYSDLVKEYPIFPSVRVLQREVEHCKFASGMLHEVFDIIQGQIPDWPDEHKDCHLSIDEMAIDEMLVYDSGLKKTVGNSTFPTHSGKAKKALVFMLAGTSLRWKYAVAYYFTNRTDQALKEENNMATGNEMKAISTEIIKKAESIGLRVNCIVTDMGAENQAMWKAWKVGAHGEWVNVLVDHPVRAGEKLVIMPDTVHVFKNIPSCLNSNEIIELHESVVLKYGLSSNLVTIKQFDNLIEFEKNFELKIAFRLKDETLHCKNNFLKMRTGTAKSVICKQTEVAFEMMAKEKKDFSFMTPARFVAICNRWFDLMTNRGNKLALRLNDMRAYEAAKEDLRAALHMFKTMIIGVGRKSKKTGKIGKPFWKACQTGVIMSTVAILFLQDLFLKKKKYKFLLTGRFTQDCLENLFSLIRYKLPTPNAYQFRVNLKVITLTLMCMRIKDSCYDYDLTTEDEAALQKDFLLFSKTMAAAREEKGRALTAAEAADIVIPLVSEAHLDRIHKYEWPILYDIFGSVVRSIKNMNMRTCRCCLNAILWQGTGCHPYGMLTNLKQYTEKKPLIQVSNGCFVALMKAEVVFRMTRGTLKFVEHNDVPKLMATRMEYVWESSDVPSCHNITFKLLERFYTKRWKMYWQKIKAEQEVERNLDAHSSRTTAMHAVVK